MDFDSLMRYYWVKSWRTKAEVWWGRVVEVWMATDEEGIDLIECTRY